MQIVDFHGKKWAVDLEWEILDTSESTSLKAAKDSAKKNNSTYGIIIENDESTALGLAKKKSKVPSAALYLALANHAHLAETNDPDRDWIVVEELPDDKYWMCVIKEGVPTPDSDKILDITTVKNNILSFLEVDTYHIYSTSGDLRTLFEDIKLIEPRSINDLTQNVTTKIKYQKLRGLPTGLLYGAVGLAALLVVGMIADAMFEQYTMRKNAENALKAQQEEREKRQAEYQAKLNVYKQEVEKMKQQARDNVLQGLAAKPERVLFAWYEAIGGFSPGTNGWNFSDVTCTATPLLPEKSSCVLNFTRTGLTTNRMLLEDFPDANIAGDKASVKRAVLADKSMFNKPNESVLKNLPTSKTWGFDMVSQLQLLKVVGVNYEIKPSEEIMITPPMKPLSPEESDQGKKPVQPAPEPIGLAQGVITITSDNFDILKEISDNVNFIATGVQKADFKMGNLGSVVWTVTLNYYIRTNDGAMTGSNSNNLSDSAVDVKGPPTKQGQGVVVDSVRPE